MAASPCGNHLAREGRLARASAQLLMHSRYLFAPFGNCNIVALACRAVNWQRALSYMGTSEPVRAPPEVSRTRGHKLAKPRSDRIVVEFRALKSAISGSTMGLGGKIMEVSFAAKLRP